MYLKKANENEVRPTLGLIIRQTSWHSMAQYPFVDYMTIKNRNKEPEIPSRGSRELEM